MTLRPISPDDMEVFTLRTHPRKTFSSSSSGVSGSVQLFPRASPNEKEVQRLSMFNESSFNDHDLQQTLGDIQELTSSNISLQMSQYLTLVNQQSVSARRSQTLEVTRFEPSFLFTKDTQRKNVVHDVLYPYYRHVYPGAHWAFTNYNTLNFFTASVVPAETALLYPNVSTDPAVSEHISGVYVLSNAFTFEFYINPRYSTDGPFDGFKAGTLFHLSSSYAVSIITGSSRDETGRSDGFRLLLQVSGGADLAPSLATTATDLCFLSDDNVLRRNRWHHCAIRWSSNVNARTGSFVVDNALAGQFVIRSSSIAPVPRATFGEPTVLTVGNYYEGVNSSSNLQAVFFNENIAQREGLRQLTNTGDPTIDTPPSWSFTHPLNAEVHELKLHRTYRTLDQLSQSSMQGSAETGSLAFYVPPFFTKQSPIRQPFGNDGHGWLQGGVMQTPFFAISGTTDDPFNVALSFGVGGRTLNLENFTRDFANGIYPRLLHLSASVIGASTNTALSANSLLYDEVTNFNTGSIRKRNLTVLPNDNGLFRPEFGLLASGSSLDPASGSIIDRFQNALGHADLSLVSLEAMLSTSSLLSTTLESGSFFEAWAGASPESPGVEQGSVLTVLQRTRDPSSNEVVFFDVSNLFYGRRLHPGGFSVQDAALTGSGGKVSMTLRDNGQGGLYRADARTKHATWCNVGDVFYDEGIAMVKAPTIPFFGKDQFEVKMEGEQNIHVLRIHALAPAGEINSSSNPSFLPLSASLLANETGEGFVYITGLNFHDENLNVIARTKLAQPVMKRNGDRLLFRVKLDF